MIKKVLCLLIFTTLSLASSLKIATSTTANNQVVFLIYNSRDIYGTNVYKNITYTLSQNGIEAISWDLEKNSYLPTLHQYPIVGIVTEQLYNFQKSTEFAIKEYVEHGGKLIQFMRGYSDNLSQLFSIDSQFSPIDITMNGIRFLEEFSPGCSELLIDEHDFMDDGLNFAYLKPIRPIAVTLDNIPLLWETYYGRGTTLYWNCTALNTKAFRGFIVKSVTRYLEISARKVIGKSVMFVDDMPSSSWRANLEPTYSELGETDTGFYSKVLLHDLFKFNDDYAVKFSTVVVFNYNNILTQPFAFTDWDSCIVMENGKEINVPEKVFRILLSEPTVFEVGLHGYNHVQLTKPYWTDILFMQQGLASARYKWFQYASQAPTFYVPPMNEIDETGFKALRTIFPEINTLCTLYESDYEMGCNREFGIEPWNDQLIDIPRCTSGYYLTNYDRLLAYSTLEAFGIFTHFIHPDDIYSNSTNYPTLPLEWIRNPHNLPWYGEATGKNGLYYRFKQELENIESAFPWIEYDFASIVKDNIRRYAQEQSTVIVTDNRIFFNNTMPQRYLVEIPFSYHLEKVEGLEIINESVTKNKKVLLVEANTVLSALIVPY